MDLKKRPRHSNGISRVLPNGLYYFWEEEEDGRVTLAQNEDPLVGHGKPGFMATFRDKEAAYCAVDALQTIPPLRVLLTDPLLPLLREVAGALADRDGQLGKAFYAAFHDRQHDSIGLRMADERLLEAIRALRAELAGEHDKTGGEE